MSAWEKFDSRMAVRGGTERMTALGLEKQTLFAKLPKNLSFYDVTIDGKEANLAIINTDYLNEKMIYALKKDTITHGGIVFWSDSYWLITELDACTTVYTRAKMIRCNYLLKWVSDDHTVYEQWCIVEDGTKYLTGEYEDRDFIVTRGDSRIALTITKTPQTTQFHRNCRFLVDDPDSEEKLAYLLTKPLKVGSTHNGAGVFKFVLQEVVTTDDDNPELGIADYYKHFPKIEQDGTASGGESDGDNPGADPGNEEGKKVWI